MARAYCPECAGEVPVGDDGRCFLGHQVYGPEAATEAVDDGEMVDGSEASPAPAADGQEPPAVPGDEDDFDLDSLEAAVAELGLELEDETEPEPETDLFGRFDDDAGAAEVGPAVTEDRPEGARLGEEAPEVEAVDETDEMPVAGEPAPEAVGEPPEVTAEEPEEVTAEEPAEPAVEETAEPAGEEPPEPVEPPLEEPAEPAPEEPAEPAIEEPPAAESPVAEPATEPLDEPTVADAGDEVSLEAAAAAAAAAAASEDEPTGAGPQAAEEELAGGDFDMSEAAPDTDVAETPAPETEPLVEAEAEPAAAGTETDTGMDAEQPAFQDAAAQGAEVALEEDTVDVAADEEAAVEPQPAPSREEGPQPELDLSRFTARPKSSRGLLKRLFG